MFRLIEQSHPTTECMEQAVKGPEYYKRGTIEVWDFIRDQGLDYHLGCAIKYICRAGYKDSKESDLKKAIHYLENELQNTVKSSKGVSFSVRDTVFGDTSGDSEVFDR